MRGRNGEKLGEGGSGPSLSLVNVWLKTVGSSLWPPRRACGVFPTPPSKKTTKKNFGFRAAGHFISLRSLIKIPSQFFFRSWQLAAGKFDKCYCDKYGP